MLKFWKDITIQSLEDELRECKAEKEKCQENYRREMDKVWTAHLKINAVEADLFKVKEENEQLRNEVVELKAKYTTEVLKNFELVQRYGTDVCSDYERFMNQLKEL